MPTVSPLHKIKSFNNSMIPVAGSTSNLKFDFRRRNIEKSAIITERPRHQTDQLGIVFIQALIRLLIFDLIRLPCSSKAGYSSPAESGIIAGLGLSSAEARTSTIYVDLQPSMESPQSAMKEGVPSSAKGIRILLVDSDTIYLMYLATLLEQFSFQVTTIEHTDVALNLIQNHNDRFHLVMANVEMPNTDVFTFIRSVLDIKDLPIILIFPKRNIEMAAKALHEGACFSLVKPISSNHLKNVWQYVYNRRRNLPSSTENGTNTANRKADWKGKKKVIVDREVDEDLELDYEIWIKKYLGYSGKKNLIIRDESGNEEHDGESKRKNSSDEKIIETSSFEWKRNNSSKRKESNSAQKNKRCVWDKDLHNKFMKAISELGYPNAQAKTILKEMNVPNLTLTQVTNHLQRYKAKKTKTAKVSPNAAAATQSQASFISLGLLGNLATLINRGGFLGGNDPQSSYGTNKWYGSQLGSHKENHGFNEEMRITGTTRLAPESYSLYQDRPTARYYAVANTGKQMMAMDRTSGIAPPPPPPPAAASYSVNQDKPLASYADLLNFFNDDDFD